MFYIIMEVSVAGIEEYAQYKKIFPQYKPWKEERDSLTQKKVQYLSQNPLSKDEYNKEIQRAKIVLDAVNVIDEYSQTKAEDMEQVTLPAKQAIISPITQISTLLSFLYIGLSKGAQNALEGLVKGNCKNIHKLIPAFLIMVAPILAAACKLSFWGAKKEIEASREGRNEAMQNNLASLNQFAVLDEEQQKQVEQTAPSINVDKKEAKKAINAGRGLGIIDSIKSIFNDSEGKKILYKPQKADEKTLSQDDILEAKKDMDLIQNVVEKIDIASQDYAENTELAMDVLYGLSTLFGGAGGLITAGLFKNSKYSKMYGAVVGFAIMIAGGIFGAKIQKQASRVGRFKAKQEMLAHPEQLLYVDENKYKDLDVKSEKKQKPSYFETFKEVIKNYFEYTNYIKENNVKDIQIRKAKETVKLTDEQKTRARQLQQNVFTMFNKLDEKSQSYSESTEALGETVEEIAGILVTIPTMLAGGLALGNIGSDGKIKPKNLISAIALFAVSFAVPTLFKIFVTKEQRNASRVANMEAIRELNDYKYFAKRDYDSEPQNAEKK